MIGVAQPKLHVGMLLHWGRSPGLAAFASATRKSRDRRPQNRPNLLLWKRRGLLYSLSLQQMPALVSPHDLQACSDCEAQQRNEGIPKPNAVDVVGTRPADQIACDIVAPKELLEDGWVDLPGRCNFPGRSSPPAARRRLDICADEPSAEPSGRDVLHGRWRRIVQRIRDRRQIDFVGSMEMLQALANAPDIFRRLPVELLGTQLTREIAGSSVGGIQFVE